MIPLYLYSLSDTHRALSAFCKYILFLDNYIPFVEECNFNSLNIFLHFVNSLYFDLSPVHMHIHLRIRNPNAPLIKFQLDLFIHTPSWYSRILPSLPRHEVPKITALSPSSSTKTCVSSRSRSSGSFSISSRRICFARSRSDS